MALNFPALNENPVPSDDDFEKSLLEFLNNETYELHDLHGEMIEEWYKDKNNGPLLIFTFATKLADNFAEILEIRCPGIITFSLYLNENSDQQGVYYILLSHKQYAAISLFGVDLSPEEFAKQLALEKLRMKDGTERTD